MPSRGRYVVGRFEPINLDIVRLQIHAHVAVKISPHVPAEIAACTLGKPIQSVSLMDALTRGDIKDSGFELLAHTLEARGCSAASMLSPMLLRAAASLKQSLKICSNGFELLSIKLQMLATETLKNKKDEIQRINFTGGFGVCDKDA